MRNSSTFIQFFMFLLGMILQPAFLKAAVGQEIIVTDNVSDEGQDCFKIETPLATYFFQKTAAGFSSILDKDSNDWVGFHPQGGSGSAGEYRGIPNLGPCCHPGYGTINNQGSTSSIESQEPDKVVIVSESDAGTMATRWEIYPTHATLTVTKAEVHYWFLYEGTPGGGDNIQAGSDYYVLGNGDQYALSERSFNQDISPEWIYFGDGSLDRVLYFIHHDDDSRTDSFWPMEGNMTVFGFGRNNDHAGNNDMWLVFDSAPETFTIGFSEESSFDTVSKIANGILDGTYPPKPDPVVKPESKGFNITAWAAGSGMEFLFPLSEFTRGAPDIQILSAKGEVLQSLKMQNRGKDMFAAFWDGRDKQGNREANGIYLVRVNYAVRPLFKTFAFFEKSRL
jgi:hypothetical protein